MTVASIIALGGVLLFALFMVWYGGSGVTRPARWARVALDPA